MKGKGCHLEKYTEVLKLWQSYQINSAEDLDKYLDSFRILFAYHSGKIENDEINYHDTREIFESGKVIISVAALVLYLNNIIKNCVMSI